MLSLQLTLSISATVLIVLTSITQFCVVYYTETDFTTTPSNLDSGSSAHLLANGIQNSMKIVENTLDTLWGSSPEIRSSATTTIFLQMTKACGTESVYFCSEGYQSILRAGNDKGLCLDPGNLPGWTLFNASHLLYKSYLNVSVFVSLQSLMNSPFTPLSYLETPTGTQSIVVGDNSGVNQKAESIKVVLANTDIVLVSHTRNVKKDDPPIPFPASVSVFVILSLVLWAAVNMMIQQAFHPIHVITEHLTLLHEMKSLDSMPSGTNSLKDYKETSEIGSIVIRLQEQLNSNRTFFSVPILRSDMDTRTPEKEGVQEEISMNPFSPRRSISESDDTIFTRPNTVTLHVSAFGLIQYASSGDSTHMGVLLSAKFNDIVMNEMSDKKGVLQSVNGWSATITWNAHFASANAHFEAAHCAFNIHEKLIELSKLLRFDWGIAITTGQALSGTVGSSQIRLPVVFGTSVNLAITLAELCPLTMSAILVDQASKDEIVRLSDKENEYNHDFFPVEVVINASGEQVSVYELRKNVEFEESSDTPPTNTIVSSESQAAALNHLRQGDLQFALAAVEKAHMNLPDIHTQRMYRNVTYLIQEAAKGNVLSPYGRKYNGWENFEAMSSKIELPESFPVQAFCDTRGNSIQADTKFLRMFCEENLVDSLKGGALKNFKDRKGRYWRLSARVLGKGTYGSVLLGMGEDGKLVAIKQLDMKSRNQATKLKISQRIVDDVIHEISIIGTLHHENVVQYLGCGVLGCYAMVVMEYIPGGSLGTVVSEFGALELKTLQHYLNDVLKGLYFLHSNGIIHRDVKPQNVLLSASGTCKLTDFGTAGTKSVLDNQKYLSGTPAFMAPEQARGEVNMKSDIWSFGIMAAYLYSGVLPWSGLDTHGIQFCHKLADEKIDLRPKIPQVAPEKLKDMLQLCLDRNPEKRPDAEMLLKHPFFFS